LRIALFGGTFDPIHNGHLTIAREAARQFSLDRVLFIPASKPPHKSGVTQTPYEHRYRMVELALEGEPLFQPSRLEASAQNSYSIETIGRVRVSLGSHELFFLIGSDAFAEIRTWHRWREVVTSVDFIVVSRPGHTYQIPEGARVHPLEGVNLPVSSSEIRAKLAEGENPQDLPPAVLSYIHGNRLYR
jgi:nicotinate-nucleotide adenylyltransferase